MLRLKEYIWDAKTQLICNQTMSGVECQYILYDYTNEQIDENLDYFKACRKNNLSSYKALLFFYDYLSGEEIYGLKYKIKIVHNDK